MRPILDVAADLGVPAKHVIPWGRHKAKIELSALADTASRGKLVLVSAISPTSLGEGKTTTSIALAMALAQREVLAALCLREPSLGPVFGKKGGGTGGGKSQVEPAEDINLHFTGDLHAITSAHNLLAALIDNTLHFGDAHGLDPRRISFPRVLDVNERSLRRCVVGLGGATHGVPRETRFDITAASEVMACLCLATSTADLRTRLLRIVVGQRRDGTEITAGDIGGIDALVALLRDALLPNLVQTREGTPALVHGGPFANIAHGCSSILATRIGLTRADVVITEAGFGFDLGGEKFLHIKCRSHGLSPHAVVLVTTVRALVSHGGGDLTHGLSHLGRQLGNVRRFGLIPIVALNVFDDDVADDLEEIEAYTREQHVRVARSHGFELGGQGALALADTLLDALKEPAPTLKYLYELDAPLVDKIRSIACSLYGALDVRFTDQAWAELERAVKNGHGGLPVCIAKTPLSFSDDPKAGGLAQGFVPRVSEVRVSAGAGFVVALMGDVSTMPGLPREPAANRVRIDEQGRAHGLMQGD